MLGVRESGEEAVRGLWTDAAVVTGEVGEDEDFAVREARDGGGEDDVAGVFVVACVADEDADVVKDGGGGEQVSGAAVWLEDL